jgi:hypothetical protein
MLSLSLMAGLSKQSEINNYVFTGSGRGGFSLPRATKVAPTLIPCILIFDAIDNRAKGGIG